jgi:uncharacterized membrane protein YraQ (UPF0718 family)
LYFQSFIYLFIYLLISAIIHTAIPSKFYAKEDRKIRIFFTFLTGGWGCPDFGMGWLT